MDSCLLLLCLFQFFSTKPRDWLGRTAVGRTSLIFPILCRVGHKTLTQPVLIYQLTAEGRHTTPSCPLLVVQ